MQVALSATDNSGGSGVASIRYTTDGSTPSLASAAYSAPFTLPSTKTVRYRAYDHVGNAESAKSRLIQIDGAAPTSTITCNGGPCSATPYGAAVQVALSATDGGGLGVAAIRYTTDGSDPTPAATGYSAPFVLSSTKTVKYRAYDNAANAEPTQTRVVVIDTVAPVSKIACQGKACSSNWYRKSVKVSLSATDAGSGVAAIHYTTDGSTPTLASPVYTAPFALSASKTVKQRAVDGAGNVGAVKTTLVRVDTAGPTVSIGSPVNRASVTRSITISARVGDARSGVAKVRFYVDGRLVATDTKPAFSFKWNTTHASKGPHRLSAKAFDIAGNSRTKSIKITLR
jgi:hypothetical protein